MPAASTGLNSATVPVGGNSWDSVIRRRPDMTQHSRRPTRPAAAVVLVVILIAALGLRVGYLRERLDAPDFAAPGADALFHDYWARGLATGDWTPPANLDDPEIRAAPFLRPPAYPHLLALVYLVAGHSYLAARIFQLCVGSASVVLGFVVGRALFGRGPGLVAAAILSAYWGLVYYEGELQEPFLLTLLALALIWLLHIWAARPTWWRAAAAGLLLGGFALVRPNVLLFVPIVLPWMWWVLRRRNMPRRLPLAAVGLLAGTALAVLPATVRNYAVTGDLVLISSNGAINLYMGNNEHSDAVTLSTPELRRLTGEWTWGWFSYGRVVRGVEAEMGRSLKHAEVSAYFRRKALAHLRENPAHCLLLAAKRAALFWGPAIVSNNKVVHYERANSAVLRWLPGFPVVLAAALLGLAILVAQRRRDTGATPGTARVESCVLIVLFVATYCGSFLPFIVAERFRVPVAAVLALLGGYGLYRLGQFAAGRDLRRTVVWGVSGLALYGLARIPWVAYEPDLAVWHTARGAAYVQGEQPQRAIASYRAAVEVAPTYAPARGELARLLDQQNRLDEALAEYQAAVQVDADDPKLLYNYAGALARKGMLDDAEATYRRAIEVNPRFAAAYVNLGELLARRGRMAEAIKQYREALRSDPRHKPALYNLANTLLRQNELEEAIDAFGTLLQLAPDDARARVNLGNALARSGRADAAIDEYRRAIKIDAELPQAYFNLASVLAAEGQTQEALSVLEGLLRIQPNNAAARQALQSLKRQQEERSPP